MKKLKELKGIHNSFVDTINHLDNELKTHIKKIKKEYQKNMIDEKIRFLEEICIGEKLDFDKLKYKYLKSKEINYISTETSIKNKQTMEEDILDKIEIQNIQYYYEPKEDGIVYNINLKKVGIYKNNQIIFD